MLRINIHRGTNEIGGSCVELRSSSTRLLIDFGLPIVSNSKNDFDASILNNKSVEELKLSSLLPDIRELDGILISHSHIDHYGLLKYINDQIATYIGEATSKIIEINSIFMNKQIDIKRSCYFSKNNPFTIGNMKITPYLNDHSAFDSYSFLIETEYKRIFYSGDFRSHGRKSGAYEWFLKNCPGDIDYLILEGTSIGRINDMSEYDVEQKLIELFKSDNGIQYIWTSSQNIDRLVSIYKACLQSNKILVLDVYSVNVLNILSKYGHLPNPLKGYKNIRILFNQATTSKLLNQNRSELVYPFKSFKISSDEIGKNPEKYVVLVRPSMLPEINKINRTGGTLIYSMWTGYKQKDSSSKFLDYFTHKQFKIIDIHSSGHADEFTLREFADAINPGAIIPIHTYHKDKYASIFTQPIIVLDDNQEIELK